MGAGVSGAGVSGAEVSGAEVSGARVTDGQPREPRASDVLERMRRTATRETAEASRSSAAVDSSPTADVRHMPPAAASRPRVRYTLDLSGAQHHFLKRFSLDAGVEASRVVRSLLLILETDSELTGRVLEQLSNGAAQ